jgi:hypothetical protein
MSWLKHLRAPKSLRWRYSLRTLLVFITLFMLWGGYHAGRSWPERRAELVVRPWEVVLHRGPSPPNRLVRYPVYAYQRLVQVLWGERFIGHVTLCVEPKPEAVEAIAALPNLKGLSVYRRSTATGDVPRITIPDGSIECILAKRQLCTLELATADLGARDLRAIARHHSLESVSLSHAKLSDEDLAAMARSPELGLLRFSHCNVTGANLASAPGSTVLHSIECAEAPLGLEFAGFIGRCPNLRYLSIRCDTIDDKCVAALGPHASLQLLDLGRTKVTERSFNTIAQMPSLRYVVLPREGVSPSAMQRLQKTRPDVDVCLD